MHTMMNILREIDIFETPINNKMTILRPLYIKNAIFQTPLKKVKVSSFTVFYCMSLCNKGPILGRQKLNLNTNE